MFQRIKKRTFEVLEVRTVGDLVGRAFGLCLMALIFVNVLVVILQTVESLAS